jgi:predicted ribosome quality control (RQC) complex YloA/Tae2 family protein
MYFDALTAAAVADECRALRGGRIQEVIQVSELEIGLEVYAQNERRYLFASAHPQRSRVHLCTAKLRRGVEQPSPLLLLLRKYGRGGRIVAVRNPEFERIVRLEIESGEGTFAFIVEAMGRHANVILTQADGRVMDAIKRVGPRLSRVRPVLPGRPYVPPPLQAKLDPTALTELRLRELLENAGPAQPAWRALVNGVRGVSPLLAKEVVYRATDRVQTLASEIERMSPVLDAFHGIWSCVWEHAWQPCVADEERRVAAFAPYLLTQYPECVPVDTISEAIERYYEATAGVDAYAPARERARAVLDKARERVRGRRSAMERQLVSQETLENLRASGEMILAYAHAIQPGQGTLEAQADLDGPPLQIALDPQLTAVENAQAYFTRYEKAKSAMADIPRLLAQADRELAYLDQLATDLDLASNRPEIDEVESALAEAGHTPKRRSRPQRGQPLRIVSEDGMPILVGRSARQNDEVTFRRAAADDLWLHAIDVPGSHVIVQCGGRPVPERTLRRAAALAASYSARRGESSVLVAYTQRRYVRRIKNAGPGMVTYTHEQTIRVSPARQRP